MRERNRPITIEPFVGALKQPLSRFDPQFVKRASEEKKNSHRWVQTITSDSTHPPEGLFTKDAATIAKSLASKKVSPKGPVSGLRMLTYFINRGGKGLSQERKAELEKARRLMSERIHSKTKREGKI